MLSPDVQQLIQDGTAIVVMALAAERVIARFVEKARHVGIVAALESLQDDAGVTSSPPASGSVTTPETITTTHPPAKP